MKINSQEIIESVDQNTTKNLGHEHDSCCGHDHGHNHHHDHLPMWASSGTQHTKIGRNDPCYCGSGLKYKKCCLQ